MAGVSRDAAGAFGAMVAAEAGVSEVPVETTDSSSLPPVDTLTGDTSVESANKEDDLVLADAASDAIPTGLLSGAALYVVQPQQSRAPTGDDLSLQGAQSEPAGASPPEAPLLDTPAGSTAAETPPTDTGANAGKAMVAVPQTSHTTAGQPAGPASSTPASLAIDEVSAALDAATAPAPAMALDASAIYNNGEVSSPPLVKSGEPTQSNAASARVGNAASATNKEASASAAPSASNADTPERAPPAATPQSAPSAPVVAADTAAFTPPLDALAPSIAEDAPTALSAQPTSGSTAETAAPAPETSLSSLSRVTIETTAQIAAQITRRLEGRSTRFEMALTPDDLGRVDVSLDIDADGQLVARLAFDNPLAATELRGRADELRSQLESAGFTLAHDALDFSQRDPSAGGGFDRRQNRAFASASRMAAEAEATLAPPAAWQSLTLTPRGVDMKV